MMPGITSGSTAADCLTVPAADDAHTNGAGTTAAYQKFLFENWAGAFVEGPMKAIAQYEKAAKLLATVATPLQAALFTAYGQLAQKLPAAPQDWFVNLLLVLFVTSVTGVFVCVVYVCNARPRLIFKGGSLSALLADGTGQGLSPAVKAWEEHIEQVARCKHRWLTLAFAYLLAGSVAAISVLIYFAFSTFTLVSLAAVTLLVGAAVFFKPRLGRWAKKSKVDGALNYLRRWRGSEYSEPRDCTPAT